MRLPGSVLAGLVRPVRRPRPGTFPAVTVPDVTRGFARETGLPLFLLEDSLPLDLEEATRFLAEFSGNEFQFVTSLAVLHAPKRKMLCAVEISNITFRELRESEIQEYVRKYAVLNYAGAFESDAVLKFGERVSGAVNIGTALPVSRLVGMLREQGVEV